jgi:ribokinase
MEKKILVIGNANMELYMNMYKLPEAGCEVVDNGGIAYASGGRGVSAAIAFRRLGADSVFSTKLGADMHGQTLYSFFKENGLNTAYIKVDRDFPTGFSAVIREADGQERRVSYPGANAQITQDNLISAFSSNPDGEYMSLELPFDTVLAASRLAAARGIPIFIDAAMARCDQPLEMLPEIEIFSPNEEETREYTGVLPLGADSSLRAALILWRRVKCKYLVIKQGERGAFVYDGKHFNMISPYRPDKLVDTSSVGDAFTAATCLEYLVSGDILLAAKYGAAAGAVSVSRRGGIASLPTEEDIADFLQRRPE